MKSKGYRPAPELELEDVNGVVYPLSFPKRLLQQVSGLGMPPITHWTTRAPFQVGESHWGYAVRPRVINIVLYLRGCDRGDMYTKRRDNIEMMSPQNGAHILRLITPDGRKFEYQNVWVTGGYELSSQEQPSPHVQIGTVQLTAYDPIPKWVNSPLDVGETRDAEGRTCVATSTLTQNAELELAFTGPFLLGTTVSTATLTATNDGSWETRPVIAITGPTEDWTLTNAANGAVLQWDGYTIAAGETVTLDIPGKTVTNGAGTNLITYVGGDFGTFALDPGANALTWWSAGSAVNLTTTIQVCWYVEVLGT